MEPKRAISYRRASTNIDKQRNSLAIQSDVISAFSERFGYKLEKDFSEYQSGTDDDRPAFKEALAYAKANNCYVIIYRLDRLARTLTSFSQFHDVLSHLRFTDLGDTEPNLMLVGFMLTIAAQESVNTSIRVSSSIKHLKEKYPDRVFGNPNLFDDYGAAAIKVRQSNARAFNSRLNGIVEDLRKAGYTKLNQQVTRLNEMGITTRRGKPFTYQNLYRITERFSHNACNNT
jgi:DNA invertase Pin-like site-specific DNA recombinase